MALPPGAEARPSAELGSRDARIAGALATSVALGVLWAVSGFVHDVAFVPALIAQLFLAAVPGSAVTFFIELLGLWAMRLLTLGMLVATAAAGGEALVRTSKEGRARPPLAGAVLAAISAAAVAIAPSPGTGKLATFAGVLLVAAVYSVAAERIVAARRATPVPDEGARVGRRQMLRFSTGAALALASAGWVAGWFARKLGGPDTSVALVAPARPAVVPERGPWPDIPGLTPEVTSAEDHYVIDIDIFSPSVEADGWSLSIGGRVNNPIVVGFRELQRRWPVVEEFSVMACVSNEVGGNLVGHSAWGGVRLRDILAEAGVQEDAVDVVFTGADGYKDSVPLRDALDPSVLVAVSHNSKPLTQGHGFPCRLRVPSIYGMKNVKWLQSIEVVDSDFSGYWQQRGWSDVATVRTGSRIDVAGDDRRAAVGKPGWVAGVAWAGDRGIKRVEVSVDGGRTWAEAMLKDPISPLSWRLWAYRWVPERAGEVTVVCRATDGGGVTQTREMSDPHPAGATGYPQVEVSVE